MKFRTFVTIGIITVGISVVMPWNQASSVKAVTPNLVADIASYQPSSLDFFRALKSKGVVAVTIKLTEGSDSEIGGSGYVNPRAQDQIANAQKSGLKVNVYHFARFNSSKYGVNDAVNEAKFFLRTVKDYNISTNSVLALDVEDNDSKDNNSVTRDINSFQNYIKSNSSYQKVVTYSMRSWFNSASNLNSYDPNGKNVINVGQLIDQNIWLAEYGVNDNTYPAGTWQYTSTFNSGYIGATAMDMSYDYSGFMSQTDIYDTVNSNTEFISNATLNKATLKASITNNQLRYLNSANTIYLLNQSVDIKRSAVMANGDKYYLIAQNGNSICWVPDNAIKLTSNYQLRISSQPSKFNKLGRITTGADKFTVNGAYLKQVDGTSNYLKGQEVELKQQLMTSDGTVYYLLAQNNNGICWVNSNTVEVLDGKKIISQTSMNNQLAQLNLGSDKYSASGTTLLQVSGTTNYLLGKTLQIKKKIITIDDEVYYLLAQNNNGICWVSAKYVHLLTSEAIHSYEMFSTSAKVNSTTNKYSVKNNQITEVSGTTAYLKNKVITVREKVVTVTGKVYYLMTENGNGICWIPSNSLTLLNNSYVSNLIPTQQIGMLIRESDKYSVSNNQLQKVNGTTSYLLNRSIQFTQRVVAGDGKNYYLYSENGHGVCWIPSEYISFYSDKTVANIQTQGLELTVKKITQKYTEKNMTLSAVLGTTGYLVNQKVNIAKVATTSDNQKFYLIVVNNHGVCWVNSEAFE